MPYNYHIYNKNRRFIFSFLLTSIRNRYKYSNDFIKFHESKLQKLFASPTTIAIIAATTTAATASFQIILSRLS